MEERSGVKGKRPRKSISPRRRSKASVTMSAHESAANTVRTIELGLQVKSLPQRMVRVTNFQKVHSLRKVQQNDLVPFDSDTDNIAPNGTSTWFTSGRPGLSVTFTMSFVGGSNGHLHADGSSDPNIVGTTSPVTIVLPEGYPQNIPNIYKATNFCGLMQLNTTASDGETTVDFLNVSFDGLVAMQPHPSLKPYTHDSTHPQNNFGRQDLLDALRALGDAFGRAFPSSMLWVNDLSLPKGGTFCSHPKGHKWGGEVDISNNLMLPAERQWFKENAGRFFKWFVLHGDVPHWHCSIFPKSDESSC